MRLQKNLGGNGKPTPKASNLPTILLKYVSTQSLEVRFVKGSRLAVFKQRRIFNVVHIVVLQFCNIVYKVLKRETWLYSSSFFSQFYWYAEIISAQSSWNVLRKHF